MPKVYESWIILAWNNQNYRYDGDVSMWTKLLTLVQVGDWRKYALEAIIKLLFISSYHDKCLLFMLELY